MVLLGLETRERQDSARELLEQAEGEETRAGSASTVVRGRVKRGS